MQPGALFGKRKVGTPNYGGRFAEENL
jgi:hypothetical protein